MSPKPLSEWTTESRVIYAALKRPLQETKTEGIYVYDMDYRCDSWGEPEVYDTNSLSFKIHVQNPPKSDDDITQLPVPTTPILKSQNQPR